MARHLITRVALGAAAALPAVTITAPSAYAVAGQSAVFVQTDTYDERNHVLIATNSGSDTVTAFAVHGSRLTRIQTVASGGRFPVSVAVHGDRVLLTEAGPNALVSARLDRTGRATLSVPVATGRQGSCWTTAVSDHAYVANAAGGTITTYEVDHGKVAAFRIGHDGSLTAVGTTTVPDAVGGEGIVAS